jgi:hypothetical protein
VVEGRKTGEWNLATRQRVACSNYADECFGEEGLGHEAVVDAGDVGSGNGKVELAADGVLFGAGAERHELEMHEGRSIVDINAHSGSGPWRHNILYREIRRSS